MGALDHICSWPMPSALWLHEPPRFLSPAAAVSAAGNSPALSCPAAPSPGKSPAAACSLVPCELLLAATACAVLASLLLPTAALLLASPLLASPSPLTSAALPAAASCGGRIIEMKVNGDSASDANGAPVSRASWLAPSASCCAPGVSVGVYTWDLRGGNSRI